MDFRPGEFPEKIPRVIYCLWDSSGEFMTETEDIARGEKWMKDAREYNSEFVGRYLLVETAGK